MLDAATRRTVEDDADIELDLRADPQGLGVRSGGGVSSGRVLRRDSGG